MPVYCRKHAFCGSIRCPGAHTRRCNPPAIDCQPIGAWRPFLFGGTRAVNLVVTGGRNSRPLPALYYYRSKLASAPGGLAHRVFDVFLQDVAAAYLFSKVNSSSDRYPSLRRRIRRPIPQGAPSTEPFRKVFSEAPGSRIGDDTLWPNNERRQQLSRGGEKADGDPFEVMILMDEPGSRSVFDGRARHRRH